MEINFQKDVFEKSKYKKFNLFTVHQNLAFHLDPVLDEYENKKNIGKLRSDLIAHAQGFILETAIGTSRNLKYYPEGCKIIGTDWSSNMIEVSLKKLAPIGVTIDYKIEDTEKLTFKDDVFDTVVDTFGLESYVYPEKALSEMRRVCKKNGKILILTSGMGYSKFLNKLLDMKSTIVLKNYGYFMNKDWESLINKMNFDIEKAERKFNGTVYMYIIKNNK